MFERLYEMSESAVVQFFGYISEHFRYDFAIVHTEYFFGKMLVICLQTGRASLLGGEDMDQPDQLQQIYTLPDRQSAEELSLLLKKRIPAAGLYEQY